MRQHRKATAWKKNRKFGDKYGGRTKLKLKDRIFNREHDLLPPTPDQETPIFIVENTSRDFYFPVTIDDIKDTLKKLPEEHTAYLTHVWLAKVSTADHLRGDRLQGEFICGSGVNLVRLYAVPKDNKMIFGQNRPTSKELGFYQDHCSDLRHGKYGWYLQWTEESYKRYFLERLLLHEIGHFVDQMYGRYWSKANKKQVEDFADNYAFYWSDHFKHVADELEGQ